MLEKYLPSVVTATESFPGSEIIVVDNGSTDGSSDAAAARWPAIVLLKNPGNYGFARAVNRGVAAAKGKYICLLNTDARLQPDTLLILKTYLDAHADAGMVTAQMFGVEVFVEHTGHQQASEELQVPLATMDEFVRHHNPGIARVDTHEKPRHQRVHPEEAVDGHQSDRQAQVQELEPHQEVEKGIEGPRRELRGGLPPLLR